MDTRLKITKGNNSAKNVGGVTVLNLCKLSGHALYFRVLTRILKIGVPETSFRKSRSPTM